MITILKPGVEKVLKIFYEDRDKKLHLREIARKAGLYGQSITRYLTALEKQSILRSEKDGNLKKYSLRKNKKAYAVLTLFDIERLEKLPLLRKNAISYYISKLEEMPVFIILFGSTARGSFREDSDIDLLIIANRKIETKDAEKEASALASMKVSTFQMTYIDFLKELRMKDDHVVQSAIATGFPVINHISYYGVLYERA